MVEKIDPISQGIYFENMIESDYLSLFDRMSEKRKQQAAMLYRYTFHSVDCNKIPLCVIRLPFNKINERAPNEIVNYIVPISLSLEWHKISE